MRVYNYLFIITGLMILLYLAGITTTSGVVLQYLDPINHPENFANSNFVLAIIAIFSGILVGGVIIGYFYRVSPESYIVASFAIILVAFVGDIISILVYYQANYPEQAWVGYLLTLVLFPIAVGYLLSIVSFWRGAD